MTDTLPASQIAVQHFSHMVYLPFRIQCARKGYSFQEIAEFLTAKQVGGLPSPWQAGSAQSSQVHQTQDSDPYWAKLQHAQAHAYFHPVVRKVLFDQENKDNAFRRTFHRTDVQQVRVTLATRKYGEAPETELELAFDLVRCELEVFRMNVAVLVLELRCQSNSVLNLAHVEQFQDEFRRLYAPYFDDYIPPDQTQINSALGKHVCRAVTLVEGEKQHVFPIAPAEKIAQARLRHQQHLDARFQTQKCNTQWGFLHNDHGNIPVFDHWKHFLAPFAAQDSPFTYTMLGDDRLPTSSYIATPQLHHIERGHWVRLAFADATGNDELPYAKRFLANFEQEVCYDRFWYVDGESTDEASRILHCGYHFAWVGSSQDNRFFANSENGAFATWRTIYSRMALFAHMQKAALLSVSARISELTVGEEPQERIVDYAILKNSESVRALYQEFIEFTQVYWFDEVSPQEQGRELFAMWQKHLRTKELHAEIRQELTDLTDNVLAAQQSQQAAASEKLTKIAATFAAGSLVVGFFGMNLFTEKGIVPWQKFFALHIDIPKDQALASSFEAVFQAGSLLLVPIAAIGLLSLLLYLLFRYLSWPTWLRINRNRFPSTKK
jgi:hypothetical protein